MNLPLDMRATTLVASLDAIAAAVERGRRGELDISSIDELIAGARESAQILSRQLHPVRAMAIGEADRRTAPAGPTYAASRGSNVIVLRPRRS
ncbi:hypothetical protein [Methylobacterium sp. WL9]|uniref:hypothetical protein n=1 Tax=Methylobacterium sp. WL9 TaxID=2603898 RepID=UPI0011CBA0C0|nr:hypothetical protein [Methylobacterium sp. WL9]TXN21533.1 hypothetical protein FV217_14070 [Methylobacterium sp. WL9]